jgi:hypothetical protein
MRALACVTLALLLAGCEQFSGAADQKIADAEAIGYACRVAQKQPEACMKENETQSPSSILDGWRSADEDIKAGKLDPSLSNAASPAAEAGVPAAAETPAAPAAEPDKGAKTAPAEGAEKDQPNG